MNVLKMTLAESDLQVLGVKRWIELMAGRKKKRKDIV